MDPASRNDTGGAGTETVLAVMGNWFTVVIIGCEFKDGNVLVLATGTVRVETPNSTE